MPIRVLCFGDSLTRGQTAMYQIAPFHPYALNLQRHFDDEFGVGTVHAVCDDTTAVPGATCRDISQVALTYRRKHGASADFVVVLGGTNDLADVGSMPDDLLVAKIQRNVQTLVDSAQQNLRESTQVSDRTLVLTIPDSYDFGDQHRSVRARVNEWIVSAFNCCQVTIPWSFDSKLWAVCDSHTDDHLDGLHMSKAGYDALGTLVFECLHDKIAQSIWQCDVTDAADDIELSQTSHPVYWQFMLNGDQDQSSLFTQISTGHLIDQSGRRKCLCTQAVHITAQQDGLVFFADETNLELDCCADCDRHYQAGDTISECQDAHRHPNMQNIPVSFWTSDSSVSALCTTCSAYQQQGKVRMVCYCHDERVDGVRKPEPFGFWVDESVVSNQRARGWPDSAWACDECIAEQAERCRLNDSEVLSVCDRDTECMAEPWAISFLPGSFRTVNQSATRCPTCTQSEK